ncbi:MAG: flagellar motor switch protein FliM [Desulfuromonadaceae bacterium]|nr:flagellar motor switch protein FliM [Desulfuromonadaceae bacterium]
MERILSKDEIAELLSAFRDGSLDAELEQEPDYHDEPRRVSSFSLFENKAQGGLRLPNFDILLDAFARNASFALSNRLQRSVSVLRDSISSTDFETLMLECQKKEVIGILDLDPLKRNGLLIFDAKLAFTEVEIMLGATGKLKDTTPQRAMTAIELNVIKDVFQDCCQELNKSFSTVEDLDSSLIRVETNPRLVNIVPNDTDMVVVAFAIKFDGFSAMMRLTIPYTALEPIREKMKSALGATLSGGQWEEYLADEISEIEVNVSAELAAFDLTLRDVLNLRAGDILSLDGSTESAVRLLVEGKPKFAALAGLRDGKKAVRVVKRLRKGR